MFYSLEAIDKLPFNLRLLLIKEASRKSNSIIDIYQKKKNIIDKLLLDVKKFCLVVTMGRY